MGTKSVGKNFSLTVCAISLSLFCAGPGAAGLVCEETTYNTNLIRAVQHRLRDAKISDVRIDGKWNERTIKALQKYQKARKITPSGELDQTTFKELFGSKQEYQPVAEVVRNPHHAPADIYRRYCGLPPVLPPSLEPSASQRPLDPSVLAPSVEPSVVAPPVQPPVPAPAK
jgi:peptidoglycan hydrolase-like protein with peptidoglycan-binding domain